MQSDLRDQLKSQDLNSPNPESDEHPGSGEWHKNMFGNMIDY